MSKLLKIIYLCKMVTGKGYRHSRTGVKRLKSNPRANKRYISKLLILKALELS